MFTVPLQGPGLPELLVIAFVLLVPLLLVVGALALVRQRSGRPDRLESRVDRLESREDGEG